MCLVGFIRWVSRKDEKGEMSDTAGPFRRRASRRSSYTRVGLPVHPRNSSAEVKAARRDCRAEAVSRVVAVKSACLVTGLCPSCQSSTSFLLLDVES